MYLCIATPFNDSIFKNVSFGLIGTKWENEPDSEKAVLVEKACKEAFADEFIDRLPDVCTMLTSKFLR